MQSYFKERERIPSTGEKVYWSADLEVGDFFHLVTIDEPYQVIRESKYFVTGMCKRDEGDGDVNYTTYLESTPIAKTLYLNLRTRVTIAHPSEEEKLNSVPFICGN